MARVATSAAVRESAAPAIAGPYLPRLIAVTALYFGTAWISDRVLTFVRDARPGRRADHAGVAAVGSGAGGAPAVRLPLGVLPEAEYRDLAVALEPGDVVLFTSDGMVEAPARRGPAADGVLAPAEAYTTSGAYPPPSTVGELFGFERLLASAAYWATRAADPDDVAAGVWADLTAWCGETSQHDDMTLLVMRVPGEPPPR